MNILGRPFVLGDPEQTEWLHKQFRKEDLQNKIINGINQALEGIDEYIYEFNSTEMDFLKTIQGATDRMLYLSGIEYNEELDGLWNREGHFDIKWGE